MIPANDHRVTRTALAFAALATLVVLIVATATVEIAADWVRAS